MQKRFLIQVRYKSYVMQAVSLNAESPEEAVERLKGGINTEELEEFEIVSVEEDDQLLLDIPSPSKALN